MKKSRTTLSQIQLFNTSRCKSVILEYTFYLSIAEICTVLSYRGNFRRIHFECSIYQIRIESISRIFKNTIHSSRFECGNENSDTSDVSSTRKSRYSRTYFNPTRLFIWKFFFPILRSFPSWMLGTSWNKKKERSRSIFEAFSNRIEINKNTFVNRRFDLQYFLFS